jgi:ribosomal protein L19E
LDAIDDKISELEDQEDEVTEVAKKGKRKIKLMNKYLNELKRAISEDVVEALV